MTNPHPAPDQHSILQNAWDDVVGGMDWLKSVIYGEFSDHRTLSAIVAEMLINFIPGVVIVTSARDATAVILRLANHPEKRENLMEWVLEIADAEHIPYDAFLDKPYKGAFSSQTLPEASAILDPLRASAQSLTKPQQELYNEYMTQHYTNARLLEQGEDALSAVLPDGIPESLNVGNLIDANQELARLKRK